MTRSRTASVLVALVVLASACGGGGGGDDGGSKGGGSKGGGSGKASGAKCPIGALAKATTKPVPITLWHSMNRSNLEALIALTNRFNKSQGDVKVNLVSQVSYKDTLTKFKAGLGSGDLPDLAQIQDVDQQLVIDSQRVLPAQACIEADKYDTSDQLERITDYYTVKGQQWAVPFNVSNPVLYYDKNAFTKAGLDPEKPPSSFDEVRAASQKIVSSGAAKTGLAIKIDAWYFEHWMASGGTAYVDHDNGRKARATKVNFDKQPGPKIFQFLDSMVKDKLAIATPNDGIDHLLAIPNGNAAMTIESSAALGTIIQVLASGQFSKVKPGVGRMPGPNGPAGTLVGGAALYLINKSAPEKQEAAWRFAKFLNQPEQQAEFAAFTGYVPVDKSSVQMAPIQKRWAQQPGFKVAYDQVSQGENTVATAGPVIGDYEGVRDAVIDAFTAMFRQGLAPDKALQRAKQKADAVIQEYNSRIGE